MIPQIFRKREKGIYYTDIYVIGVTRGQRSTISVKNVKSLTFDLRYLSSGNCHCHIFYKSIATGQWGHFEVQFIQIYTLEPTLCDQNNTHVP